MKMLFKMVALLVFFSGSSAIQGQEPAQDTPETKTGETDIANGVPEVTYSPYYPYEVKTEPGSIAEYHRRQSNWRFYEGYRPTLAAYLRYYRDCHRVLLTNTKETTSFDEFMCQLVYSRTIVESARFINLDQTNYGTDSPDSIPDEAPEVLSPVTVVEHYRQQSIIFNQQNNVSYSLEEYLCLHTISIGNDYYRTSDYPRFHDPNLFLNYGAGNISGHQ